MSDMKDMQILIGLQTPPIAVGFLEEAPSGVPRWNGGSVAAGCVFWKVAQSGKSFYTTPEDHFNCPVGSHTHKISLPAERAVELEQTLGFMVENIYLAMSEVAGIPTLKSSPKIIAYSPVSQNRFEPDVVLISAKPAQAMLLYEAALSAGVGNALLNVLGRPGCAILPLAINLESAALSLGCKGNRSYTGLPDTEMYVAIPGKHWKSVVEKIVEKVVANEAIGEYHESRKVQFPVTSN